MTNGVIDFNDLDLQFLLLGETTEETPGAPSLAYSAVKDANAKWSNEASVVGDWLNRYLPIISK
ncbi:hypothetical protein K8I31_09820 [bacterium]|nr:hypothetical protein [bacterium]